MKDGKGIVISNVSNTCKAAEPSRAIPSSFWSSDSFACQWPPVKHLG